MENAYQRYKNWLDKTFDIYQTKHAIVYLKEDGSRLTLTYGQFKEAILQIGTLITNLSLCSFDRIAVLSIHSPFAVLVNVALSYLGYTTVPIDISLPEKEVIRLLQYAEVSAIFADSMSCKFLDQHNGRIVPVFEILPDFTCCLRFSGNSTNEATVDGDSDIAVIIFSSGTTGVVKGVEVTYTALLYAFEYLVRYTNLTDKVTYLDILPSNHIAGYSISISCFMKGCEVGFLEDVTPKGLSQGFLTYNPTNFIMIPKIYEVIQEKISATIQKKSFPVRLYANSAMCLCGAVRKWTGIKLRFLTKPIWSAAFGRNMRICGCGAAPCAPETARFYLNLGIDFVNVYGSTEACFPITAANCTERYPFAGAGNVNQFPEIQVRIVQPDGEGVGEIRVKTPMIMKGYFKDSELTAAAFDENGFFKTGDLGYIDSQNNLHITGRIKETILLHTGKKVSPSDIDAYYSKLCRDVKIACCGISDSDGFDTVHLFIETHGQSRDTIQNARNQILKQSAVSGSIYQITSIHEIEHIPVTSIGKVKRFLLKEAAEQEVPVCTPEQTQLPHTENVFDAIKELIKTSSKKEYSVEPDMRLQEDLGMDSLDVFELCVALEEKFNVSVEPYLHKDMTVGELEELIEQGGTSTGQENICFQQYPLPKVKADMRAYQVFMAISKMLWKIAASGQENLQSGEKYIFCPNHESYLDGLWVAGSLAKEIRWNMCSLAASHLFENRVFRKGLVVLGGIPVHRSGNTAPAMKRAYACLSSGKYNLLIHPEGTRSRSGQMGEFKQGAAKLALETGVKIVPVCINGAYELFPPHRKFPRLFDWKHLRRYRLQICFGTPIQPEGKTPDEITREIKKQIVVMKQERLL